MGMSSEEIQMFRLLFHAMYLRQHIGGDFSILYLDNTSLLRVSPLQREEEWLNSDPSYNHAFNFDRAGSENNSNNNGREPNRNIMRLRAYN